LGSFALIGELPTHVVLSSHFANKNTTIQLKLSSKLNNSEQKD
jgi:hypothetical protein